MNVLKKKITRIIAIIVSFMIVFYCSFTILSSIRTYWGATRTYTEKYNNHDSELSEEIRSIYSDLWLIGNMYFRNLDENGNFKGNKYQLQSVEENLKKQGLMNEKGKIKYPESENFGYLIDSSDYSYANDVYRKDGSKDGYEFTWKGENKSYSHYFSVISFNTSGFVDYRWYDNRNGMEYYYMNGKGFAVFDYDTNNLNSYIDELGATIYLDKDGKSPIPYRYNSMKNKYTSFDSKENDYEEYDSIDIHVDSCDDFTMIICPNNEIIRELQYDLNVMASAWNKLKNKAVNLIPLAVTACLLLFYVIISGGYDEKKKKFTLEPFGKIWSELYIILGFICVFELFSLINFYSDIFDKPTGADITLVNLYADNLAEPSGANIQDFGFNENQIILTFAFSMTLISFIFFECVNIIIIKLKCRSLIKTTFIGKIGIMLNKKLKKIYKRTKESFNDKRNYNNSIFERQFVIRVLLLVLIELLAVTYMMTKKDEAVILIIPIPFILFFYFTYKDMKELTKLGTRIDRITDGDYSCETVPKDSIIYGLNEKLNNITDGIEDVVENQIRSEKMKIELVTNVSHDLKTPLTSIISYVDLLSQEELTPEIKDYVTIIQTKTERLKEIVSDVFDLAKATSRTDVKFEFLDAVVLVNQVIADMQDTINNASNKFCTDILIDEAKILAEGKKMYRVLQNIIDNALKYSLEGTRIFMKVYSSKGKAVIELKNTSSYEMKFTAEEITERFKRGDEARTSEGNGLGLSIAKSFTEACNGVFDVLIDGDVFIVKVYFDII